LCAGGIVAHLPTISQPAVSKHLRILRETGLVRSVPDGWERSYHLNAVAL
jgi:DNA-binding transcriptional ArsR family regulator